MRKRLLKSLLILAVPGGAPPPIPVLGSLKKSDDSSRASWLHRLKRGLQKTGAQLTGLFGGASVDERLFEELEGALISADAGLDATQKLLLRLRARAKRDRIESPAALKEALAAWAERNRVAVIAQEGGDPAAVIFDAIQAARARGIDVV